MKKEKVVMMPKLPKCSFCDGIATVDGKTVDGPWAYMCPRCFLKFGVGLGLGRGQVLVEGR